MTSVGAAGESADGSNVGGVCDSEQLGSGDAENVLGVPLGDDLLLDPDGRLYCLVCKRFVPRGKSNITEHVSGKRHENNAKKSDPATRAVRREKILHAFAQGIKLSSSTLEAMAGDGDNTSSSKLEPGASLPTAPESRKPQAPSQNAVSASQATTATATLPEDKTNPSHRPGLEIDKSSFLNSILQDFDDEQESDDDGSSHNSELDITSKLPLKDLSNTADARLSSFEPLIYKPPEGSDNFFESMPEESERTNQAAKLLAVLETAAPKKQQAAEAGLHEPPSSAISKESDQSADVPDGAPSSIPIKAGSNAKPSPFNQGLSPSSAGDAGDARKTKEMTDVDGDTSDGEHDPETPPWLSGADAIEAVKYSSDPTIALHFEILEFARFMSPTAIESANREKVVVKVKSIVTTLWPECRLELFGSYATGLYLPSSDIDICIMNTPKGGDISELYQLAQAVRNVKDFARRVNVIKARVSLVKIVAREGGVQCDISFNQQNGPRNVPVIKKYLADYPALRPLLLVVKCFLQQRSLNEVFTGGLGSYAVLLLLVSHLQMLRYNFPGSKANLGAVLQNFFMLYGRQFNYCLVGIEVKQDGCYFDKFKRYDTSPVETMRFSIEDPNDETNEIGKNSYGASRIRKAFGNASMVLAGWARDDLTGAPTPLSTILQGDAALRKRRQDVLLDFNNRDVTSLRAFTNVSLGLDRNAGSGALDYANSNAGSSRVPKDAGDDRNRYLYSDPSHGPGQRASLDGSHRRKRSDSMDGGRPPARRAMYSKSSSLSRKESESYRSGPRNGSNDRSRSYGESRSYRQDRYANDAFTESYDQPQRGATNMYQSQQVPYGQIPQQAGNVGTVYPVGAPNMIGFNPQMPLPMVPPMGALPAMPAVPLNPPVQALGPVHPGYVGNDNNERRMFHAGRRSQRQDRGRGRGKRYHIRRGHSRSSSR